MHLLLIRLIQLNYDPSRICLYIIMYEICNLFFLHFVGSEVISSYSFGEFPYRLDVI